VPEPTLRLFMEYAVHLGADPHTWVRCQWVRMPGGTRYADGVAPRSQPIVYRPSRSHCGGILHDQQFNRDGKSPRELLENLLQDRPGVHAKAAEERGSLVRLPDAKPLGSLTRHPEGHDPNELLRHRFLCRGGAPCWSGPTGVGKSSLSMQAAVCWAAGKPCFGLVPTAGR
jgi:hypothetical protein